MINDYDCYQQSRIMYYSPLDEMDYVRIAESDGLVFLTFDDENRRQCFFLEITDDGLVEDTESLTIDLVFSSFLSSPSGVLLDPNVTTVQILDNDGMYHFWYG